MFSSCNNCSLDDEGQGGGGRGPGVDLGHWESLLREKAQAAAGPGSSTANPVLWHPFPNPVSLPGERGTWLQSWGQNVSQRPDLTPTLESTGSGTMTGEGLSPNQTNKLKSNCPTQPCYFMITPYNHTIGQAWIESRGNWNLDILVQASLFSVSKLNVLEQLAYVLQASVSLSMKWRQWYSLQSVVVRIWGTRG